MTWKTEIFFQTKNESAQKRKAKSADRGSKIGMFFLYLSALVDSVLQDQSKLNHLHCHQMFDATESLVNALVLIVGAGVTSTAPPVK
jgi:hypothetical protein